MKVYYLKLTEDDFTKDGPDWTSNIIDLYDNDTYTNFSTTKSHKGLNLLTEDVTPSSVWIGMTKDGSGVTDTGFISGGRYVDTSGRINILTYSVDYSDFVGSETLEPTMDMYFSDDDSEGDPLEDWASRRDINQYVSIYEYGAPRFTKIVVHLDTEADVSSLSLTLLIRVEIDEPIMVPMFDKTRNLLDKFPEWMAIREIDNQDHATPELATPISLGGKFLNALSGEWLDDLSFQLTYTDLQRYIDTADTSQVAWIYQSSNVDEFIFSVVGDTVTLANTTNLSEFYKLTDEEDGYWWDEARRIVYTNKEYTELLINGTVYVQAPQRIWNWFDEFGLVVDLKRLWLEDNDTFKKRILDVYRNAPGVGVEAFKKALRRELNLWRYEGATPDSDFLGATPELLDISDIEIHEDYVEYDGMPKAKFIELVHDLAERFPVTWGYFVWNQAIWDVGGPSNEGFGVLPHRFDATPADENYLQSGVGDLDDLIIGQPRPPIGLHEAAARFKLRGRALVEQVEYPAVEFDLQLNGVGNKQTYDNPEFTGWFTIVLEVFDGDASPTTKQVGTSVQISATSDVDVTTPSPTPNSYSVYTIFGDDGLTDNGLTWWTEDGFITGDDDNEVVFDIADLVSFSVDAGQISDGAAWGDPLTDVPTSAHYEAWISTDPSDLVNVGGAYDDSFGATPTDPSLVVKSLRVSYTTSTWISPVYSYHVVVNGGSNNQLLPYTITPNILWSDYVSSRQIYVGIDADSIRTIDTNGASMALDETQVYVNGSNAWSSYLQSDTVEGFAEIEFTVPGDDIAYPILTRRWEYFEDASDSDFTVSLDENGPYLYGTPRRPGNQNFVFFASDSSNRGEFALPQSDDYVITWMGVETDDEDVIMWLDSNTVKPAVEEGEISIEYPENSIVEVKEQTLTAPSGLILTGAGDTDYVSFTENISSTEADDITIHMKLDDYGNAGWTNGVAALLADNRLSVLLTTGGEVIANWLDGSSASLVGISSVSISTVVDDGAEIWLRVLVEPNYSASHARVKFATSDDGFRWTALGDAQLVANADKTRTSFALSHIGNNLSNTVGSVSGYVYKYIYRQGINGTRLRTLDFTDYLFFSSGATGGSDRHANNYVVEGAASIDSNGFKSYFTNLTAYARLRTSPNRRWNPTMHDGWFYEGGDELYHYINPLEEQATVTPWALADVSRQGAPVNIWAYDVATPSEDATPAIELRQVPPIYDATPADVPYVVQQVYGSGTNALYLAYEDIYDATVVNIDTGATVAADTSTDTNVLATTDSTSRDTLYEVTYTVNYSFFIQNDYVDDNGDQRSKLFFDQSPTALSPYLVTYETSKYESATPIDISLNTAYTIQDEGYIFLSHEEYPLSRVEVRLSPSVLVADGQDYLMLSIRSLDQFGNPKPNQDFSLYSNFGTLSSDSVITDIDGYAVATLTAGDGTVSLSGSILVDGAISVEVPFRISPKSVRGYRLTAAPSNQMIPADYESQNNIYGRVEDATYSGVPYAAVMWKKGRSIYDIFSLSDPPYVYGATPGVSIQSGMVVADENGFFNVGPFVSATPSDTGYWFVALESEEASPSDATPDWDRVGDVVFWYEYPDAQYGVEEFGGLPQIALQNATPWSDATPYTADAGSFPLLYDEATPTSDYAAVNIEWTPPAWYAIDRYTQYQLGLLGSGYYESSINNDAHPDYRDL